jgi:hypothetical protein
MRNMCGGYLAVAGNASTVGFIREAKIVGVLEFLRPLHPDAKRAGETLRLADFRGARALAERRLAAEPADAEAARIALIAAHALGDDAAVLARCTGPPAPRNRRSLDELIMWSSFRARGVAAAEAFAGERGLARRPSICEQLRLAREHPLEVQIDGLVELPFTNDDFSRNMPGVPVTLNGRQCVARLDTGGEFVHLTKSQAESRGIRSAGRERAFVGLVTAGIEHGVTDLEIGGARFRNVPAAVHDDATLPVSEVARQFGADMDLIIGTNVFEQFLTTIDSPRGRLLMSGYDDATACAVHQSMLRGTAVQVEFGRLGSHTMIAAGRVGERPVRYFIDSGLAVFPERHRQAGMLVGASTVRSWGMPVPTAPGFLEIEESVQLGGATQPGLLAYVVPDSTWRSFGDWNGIDVTVLLSQAFFTHYAWTIDFPRRMYTLRVT